MQAHDHTADIPAHVPPELVEQTTLAMGNYTEQDPFAQIIPEACDGPTATYATNIYPGGGPAWVFRRLADLREVYNDTEHFTARGFSPFARLIGESWSSVPSEIDPPLHTRFRVMLNKLFSPPEMAKMEEGVRAAARRSIATFAERNECELMKEFAFPFPVSVVLDLLALPQERMEEFLSWERKLLHSGDLDVIAEGTRQVVDYLRGVIEERKRKPGDDLISFAIKGEVDGRKMTDDELIGFAFNLYIGGLDTVSANIGLQFRHLATHLDDQRRLRENPAMIGQALDEFMRAYAAVTTFRTCTKEREIAGVTVKPGDKVAMCTTLAGRDAEAYDQPHEVRLDRKPTHVSFGFGPHFCLGIHLAKRELRIAMEEMFKAIPEFGIAAGATIKSQTGGVIQPTMLPLVW